MKQRLTLFGYTSLFWLAYFCFARNTWIIITADHGHRYPHAEELKEKERFKIPMLWIGGAITKKDTVIHAFASQTDISNSVLGQLGPTNPQFEFSKNILAQPDPFALYIFNNGYGYIDPTSEHVYDFDLNGFLKNNGTDESIEKGRVYMQQLFNDYNQR